MINLIGNAIKFSDTGAVTVTLAREADCLLRFTVTDNGIGISEEQQTRLFQVFSQGDESTNRKYGGTGLGLAIAKDLVQLAGGKIGVHSIAGEGSTFWFTLPLQPASKELPAPPPRSRTEAGMTPLTGHVLLAEDNLVNQVLAVATLNSFGLAVTVARDGRAAVAAHRTGSFDLILMDCHLPEIDGLQAAAEIRRYEASERSSDRVPIVALTADSMAGDRERCLAAGMDDYLSKPFEEEKLRTMLARLLTLARDAQSTTANASAAEVSTLVLG